MALLFLPQNFLSRPAAGVCFVFELCHKMSLGQAEGVIRAILMILKRFSSDLGAFGTCFVDFRFNLETGWVTVGAFWPWPGNSGPLVA